MFFFSSRRLHTRWTGDWSSDVCSSDLALADHRGLSSGDDTFVAQAQNDAMRRVDNPAAPRRILCPTLVGRETELAALDALFAEALRGAGRTVLIAGDAGIGKSRLLAAFIAHARS